MMTEAMKMGGRYNWKNQPERLVYIGRSRAPGQSYWHQFEKVDEPGVVWCEVLDFDLHRIEATPCPTPHHRESGESESIGKDGGKGRSNEQEPRNG